MRGMNGFVIPTAFIAGWFFAVSGVGESAPAVMAQRTAGERVASEAFASHSLPLADGRQQITVIDGRLGSIAVYHVNAGNGAISLKSVRNIAGDLRMDDYNGGSPSPKEIRTLMDQR